MFQLLLSVKVLLLQQETADQNDCRNFIDPAGKQLCYSTPSRKEETGSGTKSQSEYEEGRQCENMMRCVQMLVCGLIFVLNV